MNCLILAIWSEELKIIRGQKWLTLNWLSNQLKESWRDMTFICVKSLSSLCYIYLFFLFRWAASSSIWRFFWCYKHMESWKKKASISYKRGTWWFYTFTALFCERTGVNEFIIRQFYKSKSNSLLFLRFRYVLPFILFYSLHI